jgi:sRNA-binding regulator protein Hfq
MNRRNDREASPALHSSAPAASPAAVLEPPPIAGSAAAPEPPIRKRRPQLGRKPSGSPAVASIRHFAALPTEDHGTNRQAELFYLQKQIQQQTQMVFILEDGSRVQGVVEWYDRNSIKVRGKSRVLIYKSAIKYLYKAGEIGSGVGE